MEADSMAMSCSPDISRERRRVGTLGSVLCGVFNICRNILGREELGGAGAEHCQRDGHEAFPLKAKGCCGSQRESKKLLPLFDETCPHETFPFIEGGCCASQRKLWLLLLLPRDDLDKEESDTDTPRDNLLEESFLSKKTVSWSRPKDTFL